MRPVFLRVLYFMEIWKDIPNYEGYYQISDLGRVKRLPVEVKNRFGHRIARERILKCSKDYYGYHVASLSIKSKVKKWPVHQLVGIVFLSYVKDGKMDFIIDHKDNNRSNNSLSNLQIISHRKNCNKDIRGVVRISGVKKSKSRYNSSIRIDKKKVFLGQDKDPEVCGKMYQLACANVDKYNGNPADFRIYIRSLL